MSEEMTHCPKCDTKLIREHKCFFLEKIHGFHDGLICTKCPALYGTKEVRDYLNSLNWKDDFMEQFNNQSEINSDDIDINIYKNEQNQSCIQIPNGREVLVETMLKDIEQQLSYSVKGFNLSELLTKYPDISKTIKDQY